MSLDKEHLLTDVATFDPFHIDAEWLVSHFQLARLQVLQFSAIESFLLEEGGGIVGVRLNSLPAEFEEGHVQLQRQFAAVDRLLNFLVEFIERKRRRALGSRRTGFVIGYRDRGKLGSNKR